MNAVLSTILILTSCAQVRRADRPVPEPGAKRVMTVNIRVRAGSDLRKITLSSTAPPAPTDDDDDQPAPPVGPLNIDALVVEPGNFDRWLFGAHSRGDPKRHLEEILLTRVRTVAREHGLNKQQAAKLQLAGRGDIKRFFDEVENKRKDFEIESKSFTRGMAALEGLAPLSQVYQGGPFEADSLFAKTLRKINNDRRAGD
jgi:hypothetical protein